MLRHLSHDESVDRRSAAVIQRRLTILCNPSSGRVRRRWGSVKALRGDVGAEAYREASTPEEIAGALAELAPGAGDLLAVVGGDGTIQATLTALHRRMPAEQWPTLVPLCAGSTNMTALDLGAPPDMDTAVTALRRLRSGNGPPARTVHRPLLLVERRQESPLCGMFLGVGAVADGVGFFRRRLRGRGGATERTSALSILRVLISLATGGDMARGNRVWCRIDGGAPFDGVARLGLVSTLHRLLLGMRPYWGRGPGPLHVTLVEREARARWRSLWRLAAGRPGRRLTPERGYVSHNALRVELRFDGAFVIDGELFEARAADGALVVTAPRTVAWMVPA